MNIDWTDTDPVTGEKRFVQAEKFARKWSFKVRFRRRTNWQHVEPTRELLEVLIDALERRVPRREGVTEEDVARVRAELAKFPETEDLPPPAPPP
jgi:hypothetical protein